MKLNWNNLYFINKFNFFFDHNIYIYVIKNIHYQEGSQFGFAISNDIDCQLNSILWQITTIYCWVGLVILIELHSVELILWNSSNFSLTFFMSNPKCWPNPTWFNQKYGKFYLMLQKQLVHPERSISFAIEQYFIWTSKVVRKYILKTIFLPKRGKLCSLFW